MAFKSLLDPSFQYRNSSATDIRITFDRVRREMEEQGLCVDERPLIGEIGQPTDDRSPPKSFKRR